MWNTRYVEYEVSEVAVKQCGLRKNNEQKYCLTRAHPFRYPASAQLFSGL